MKEDMVSIAMASYNGEKYIVEQIESILHQTFKNIEIVIVDDGSKDKTISLIKELQQLHPVIHLYENEKNSGITKTFEVAAMHCHGNYIAFCDQDDIWLPHKLEKLMNAIGDHDVAYGNSLLVDESGVSLNRPFNTMMNLQTYYSGVPFLLSNCVPGHAMLARKSFIQKILPFPNNLFFDLWIGFNAAASNGMIFVDEVLVYYRQHHTNAVGTSISKNKRKKETASVQFEKKKAELITLSNAPITDVQTKVLIDKMIGLFNRQWSLNRSAFFFRHFNLLLSNKQKPAYRKVLYCIKMFFKPNF